MHALCSLFPHSFSIISSSFDIAAWPKKLEVHQVEYNLQFSTNLTTAI